MAIAPAVLMGISTAATVASTAIGVVGSMVGAASEADAYNQQAEIAARNKKIAIDNANRTLIIAQEEQMDLGTETAQLLGEQEAIQAGSGLSMNSRSFVQTRAAAKQLARIDQLNVQEAAEIRAQAYRNEGDSYAAEAISSRKAAGNATLKGFLGAGSSLISGAGSLVRAAPARRTGSISVPSPVYV